jgi:hypothetical protein
VIKKEIWNKSKLNSEKKGKLNSEKIWEIWKKCKLNGERIWKIRYGKYGNKIS